MAWVQREPGTQLMPEAGAGEVNTTLEHDADGEAKFNVSHRLDSRGARPRERMADGLVRGAPGTREQPSGGGCGLAGAPEAKVVRLVPRQVGGREVSGPREPVHSGSQY